MARADFLHEKAEEIEARIAELVDLFQRLEPGGLDDPDLASLEQLAGEASRLSNAFLALAPLWNEPHRTRRLRSQIESLAADYARVMPAGTPPPSFPRAQQYDEVEVAQKAVIAEEEDEEDASGMSGLVFLCHSSGDKPAVRRLERRLKGDGFRTWLDDSELLPGQDWDHEIRAAVRRAALVVVCLSQTAVTKTGYLQKEIRIALDVADEQPPGAIFVIPARLEECDVPERLSRWQWVDLFRRGGYHRLRAAVREANNRRSA